MGEKGVVIALASINRNIAVRRWERIVVRITPFILILIGLFGLFDPEKFLANPHGAGRWIFVVIIALGVGNAWRTYRRTKANRTSSND